MVRKKKEGRLILYRKYLHDNHLDTEPIVTTLTEKRTSLYTRIWNMVLLLIIIIMMALSAVGIVTLMHPQMRMMFFQVVVK